MNRLDFLKACGLCLGASALPVALSEMQKSPVSFAEVEHILELARKKHPDMRVSMARDYTPVSESKDFTENFVWISGVRENGERCYLEEFTEMLGGLTIRFRKASYFVIDSGRS